MAEAEKDGLELIKEELEKMGDDSECDREHWNPFKLPMESQVFGGRERDKRKRNLERRQLMHLTLIQRADMQKPTVPICITQPKTNLTALIKGQQSQSSLDKRKKRVLRIQEFLHEKREMFLLQLMIDQQQEEIRKIQKEMTQSEKDLIESEEMVDKLTKEYKLLQTRHESVIARGRRKAELATQKRVDVLRVLRHSLANISQSRSEIMHFQDLLESHRIYAGFLRVMTPEKENTTEYFKSPDILVNNLNSVEDGNLILIQACQYLGDKVDDVGDHFKKEFIDSKNAMDELEGRLKNLAEVSPIPEMLSDQTQNKAKLIDNEYERIKNAVESTYDQCFGKKADISPLGMLTKIEEQLYDFYKRIRKVKPEFVLAKQAQRDKFRRDHRRLDKQKKQEMEQRVKLEQAIERANRPVKQKTGRPLVPKSKPFKAGNKDNAAQILALLEQQRIEALLYGVDEQ
jgi:hypothetical protein